MNAKEMVMQAAVYVPSDDCESIRIIARGDTYFCGEGEETGESYHIGYDEVDLEACLLYKFVLLNP